ncbi:prenyltransferase/squalene oxidase repeat-containing protein [Streptomyces sp. MNP-20]|uniref:prenyltransferase/squalene oxidase repeat-containing protein n=1 Tax=Streptomyces sp. MNP-20 TaxID=2721165 RepID=UPI001555BF43|nr:prenyltransferase/squalene oxidase repeat-containing protein [Streptomyces sp. MNP-20]
MTSPDTAHPARVPVPRTAHNLPAPLAERARQALDAAVAFALHIQHADGCWEEAPDPRILESAVAAHALSSYGPGTEEPVHRAHRWLRHAAPQTHHPVAEALERWLQQLALFPSDVPAPPLSLGGPHQGRAVLVHALAVSARPPAADSRLLLDGVHAVRKSIGRGPVKQWQQATLTAAELLARARLSLPLPPDGVTGLAAHQSGDGSFCLMPTVTALACLALRAAGDHRTADRGRDWLVRTQHSDGTWRFLPSGVWDTALMVRCLRGHPLFDARALPPAADYLERTQSPDGGWSFKHGLESDPDTMAMTLLALAGTDQGHRTLPAARAFARATQLPDGRWRSWQSADDRPAPDVTAHMVSALHRTGAPAADLAPARSWLHSLSHGEQGWTAEWYAPPAYALREIAEALGWSHPASHRAAHLLLHRQNDDGGWPVHPGGPSHPAATGLALSALTRTTTAHHATTRALHYLCTRQHSDGSWPGTPIMYGPRPFLSHIPTHTHAFSTLGLHDLLRVRTRSTADLRTGSNT